MLALTLMLHIVVGATLAGTFIIIALVAGFTSYTSLILAGVGGMLLAMPVSYAIARQIK